MCDQWSTRPRPHLAEPVREWIADARRLRAQAVDLGSADATVRRRAARELSDRLAAVYTAPAPGGVAIDECSIVADQGRTIRVRRYRPAEARGSWPTQIWLHGGGFVTGAVDELVNDRLCAARSAATGVQLLSVEYRLAPEHAYPAQLDDVVAVFDWAVSDRSLGADPTRVGIGGNSAGGTIAASAALRIRDTRPSTLIHVLLEVPQLTFEPFGVSAIAFDLNEGPLAPGDADLGRDVRQAYLPPAAADRYAVPLDADLGGSPPTLVLTAEFDPLRDAGEEYATRLRDAGVPATSIRGRGHLHGSCSLTARWDGARQWQASAAESMLHAYRS
jgi:acetyl esterase